MNPLDMILSFAMNNILLIVGMGVLIYFFYSFFRILRRTKTTVLRRSDVERKNMERRLKNNPAVKFKWLYHPKEKLIGKITHMRNIVTEIPIYKTQKSNPNAKGKKVKVGTKKFQFLQLSVKPVFLNLKFVKIPNYFAKTRVFQISDDGKLLKDEKLKEIVVPPEIAFDYQMGIDYDLDSSILDGHENLIQNQMLETDYDLLASRYFVKSQEQCVYDPEKAHALAMKEKELQIELARRRGKMTTI